MAFPLSMQISWPMRSQWRTFCLAPTSDHHPLRSTKPCIRNHGCNLAYTKAQPCSVDVRPSSSPHHRSLLMSMLALIRLTKIPSCCICPSAGSRAPSHVPTQVSVLRLRWWQMLGREHPSFGPPMPSIQLASLRYASLPVDTTVVSCGSMLAQDHPVLNGELTASKWRWR